MKYGKDGFGSDEEEMMGLMDSNEDVSQMSSNVPSNLVSPTEADSNLTSPSSNLDKELEKLLLDEARKQGMQSFDAVRPYSSIIHLFIVLSTHLRVVNCSKIS